MYEEHITFVAQRIFERRKRSSSRKIVRLKVNFIINLDLDCAEAAQLKRINCKVKEIKQKNGKLARQTRYVCRANFVCPTKKVCIAQNHSSKSELYNLDSACVEANCTKIEDLASALIPFGFP